MQELDRSTNGLGEVAYERATAAVENQAQILESVRKRSLTMLAVASTLSIFMLREAVSVDAGAVLGSKAVLVLTISAFSIFCSGFISWPKKMSLEESGKIILDPEYQKMNRDDALRWLATYKTEAWAQNRAVLNGVMTVFRFQFVTSVLATLGWIWISADVIG